MEDQICSHCQDWKGKLQEFFDAEGGLVFAACPRCVDTELKKSAIGLAFKARCERFMLYNATLNHKIRRLETELDIRMLHPEWKSVHAEERVMPGQSCRLIVSPRYTPFFLPKAVRIRAVKANATSEEGRFSFENIHVGGAPQEHDLVACDFRKPLRVEWSVISATGLGRELMVEVKNEEETDVILTSVTLWGEPVQDLYSYSQTAPWMRRSR